MSPRLRILFIEDSVDDTDLLLHEVQRGGYVPEWERVDTADALTAALGRQEWDVITCDYVMPRFDAQAALEIIRQCGIDTPALIVSGEVGEEVAVAAMKAGAVDFVSKHRLTRLVPAIERELREADGRRARRRAEEALRVSAQRYRDMVETSHDVIWSVDVEGRVTFVNQAVQQVFGYTPEEMIGRPFPAFLRPPHTDAMASFLTRIQTGEGLVGYETRVLRKDEEVVVLRSNAALLRDTEGRITGATGTSTDITARQRMEEALRESEARFSNAFEHAPLGMALVGLDGRPLRVNRALCQMFGYSEAQLLTMSVWDNTHPDDMATSLDHLRRMVEGEAEAWHLEKRFIHPDGHTVWGLSDTSIVRAGDGRALLISQVQDITERKQAEEERARLSAALEQLQDSVMITTADGTIIYVNRAFECLTGYTRAEIYGCKPQVLRAEPDVNAALPDVYATIARREAWKGTDTQRRKDGTLFQLELTISPVHDAEGRLINLVGIGHDVTHERQLDAQLRHAQKMEAVGRLAAGVAHEFNNQLTVVKGSAQLLLSKLSPADPARRDAERITVAVDRSAGLVHQLLTLSRRHPPDARPLNLTDVVNEVAPMLRVLLGEQLALRVVVTPDVRPILADRSQVEQLLMHLVAHARDTLAPDACRTAGGIVWVEAANAAPADMRQHVPDADSCGAGHVRLTVRDDGPSLPAGVREHIFEPFYTTKELGRGSGLGLATVFGIVQQHHGHIACTSGAGAGTAFHIYWGATSDGAVTVPPKVVSVLAGHQMAASPGTVLVVEDEGDVRALLVRALMQAGYDVYSASTADEGLAVAARISTGLDVLVTDVIMPGESGATLARQLRQRHPAVRVLFISGHLADPLDLTDVPGAQFLPKPFGLNEFLTAVGGLLAALGTI